MRQTVRRNQSECTGCGACVSVCPRQAITMQPDEEGFLYPKVDALKCIECDACEKRCPAGRLPQERQPRVWGAQIKEEAVRRASSSGGVFTALARGVLAKGGVVFGAAFGEGLRVEHIGAFNEEELSPMRGSKYVQSDAADAIANAVSLLRRGIPVLFSGTPCQVDGLLAALGGRHTEALLTVDFVCHGVPSPGVFASYIGRLEREKGQKVRAYTFRDKRLGWKNFSAVATFEDGTEHTGTQVDEPFLYGFLQNLYLRPACHGCAHLRGNRHPADITLADLWGAEALCPARDDDTGLSLVMANTEKGKKALEACKDQLTHFGGLDMERMTRANPGLICAPRPHPKRRAFFKDYARRGFDPAHVMRLLSPPGRAERLIRRIAHLPVGALRRIRNRLGI